MFISWWDHHRKYWSLWSGVWGPAPVTKPNQKSSTGRTCPLCKHGSTDEAGERSISLGGLTEKCIARKAGIFPPFSKSCASPLIPTNVLFLINVQLQPEDRCVEPEEGNHFTSVVRDQLGHCVNAWNSLRGKHFHFHYYTPRKASAMKCPNHKWRGSKGTEKTSICVLVLYFALCMHWCSHKDPVCRSKHESLYDCMAVIKSDLTFAVPTCLLGCCLLLGFSSWSRTAAGERNPSCYPQGGVGSGFGGW